MGCVSTKILTKSTSFQEEVNQSFQRRLNGSSERNDSENSGDQLLALLHTANMVSRRIKSASQKEESRTSLGTLLETKHSEFISTEEPKTTSNSQAKFNDIETINAWELLAGLEEDKDVEDGNKEQRSEEGHSSHKTEEYKYIISNEGGIVRTRSLRTVEEYDAMVAGYCSSEEGTNVIKNSKSREAGLVGGSDSSIEAPSKPSHHDMVRGNAIEPEGEELKAKSNGSTGSTEENFSFKINHATEKGIPAIQQEQQVELEIRKNGKSPSVKESIDLEARHPTKKGSKREAMSKELAALSIPAFEFRRSGSLREWLLLGGQVFSPGSYVTPKFGNFILQESRDGAAGDEINILDPEFFAQFEQAMKQQRIEEEKIIKEILESLEEGQEEELSRREVSKDHVQLQY